MRLFAPLLALSFLACSSSSESDAPENSDPRAAVVSGVHSTLSRELVDLHAAAVDLQNAAPTHAWTASDAGALAAMRTAWRRTRVAYEHIEGAIAPIFPDIDTAIDARYDDYLVQLGGKGDPNLFDGEGVTGMHAIERILYADSVPERTVAFERTLPGYSPAAVPTTDADAVAFKTKLVQRLIDDVAKLEAQWKPAELDLSTAFQGLISLMNEQQEKVSLTATGEEESRYAQMTIFDLRNNLVGTRAVYDQFRPWLLTQSNGVERDRAITASMDSLSALYASYPGDAMPEPPATWSSESPSAADLATPFGKLFAGVEAAVDPTSPTSLVSEMNAVAKELGL